VYILVAIWYTLECFKGYIPVTAFVLFVLKVYLTIATLFLIVVICYMSKCDFVTSKY